MIKGKSLMIGIKVNNTFKTIAMATSCSMDMTTSLSDSSTKDDNDTAISQEVTGKNWKMSTENLIPANGNNLVNVQELASILLKKEAVRVRFSLYEGSLGKETGDGHDWNAIETPEHWLEGDAICESLDINGANKENASISANFLGKGKPTIGTFEEVPNHAPGE